VAELVPDSALPRPDPDWATDERTTLLQFLGYYRTTIHRQVDGLSDEQAASASVPPSMLTLTGLVRHMTEVERNWFRRCFAAEAVTPEYYSDEHPDGDLEVDASISIESTVAAWQREIAICDAIVAAASSLDQLSAGTSRLGGRPNLRWIVVHLIEEYARHCGHADLIRERIDGAVDR
jgi:Protein of unknown function (DUF664)